MVYHVLKDGTITKDITGHIVKVKDAETLYKYISTIKPGKKRIRKDRRLLA